MKFLKLITLNILALTAFSTTVCMDDEADRIFENEIKPDIERNNPQDFDKFQDTPLGLKLSQEISALTQVGKDRLLLHINGIGGDPEYRIQRPYFKLLILNGANINKKLLNIETILSHAVIKNDLSMVTFLLDHDADATSRTPHGPLLQTTKNYHIAKLLIDHGALSPYANNTALQKKLLSTIFISDYDPRLLYLYKDALKSKYNSDMDISEHYPNSNLQNLLNASEQTPIVFFEKLKFLLNNGMVDLQAKDILKQRPIDTVNNGLKYHRSNPTLLLAKRLLTDLENDPVAFNVLTRKVPKPQP